MRWIALLAATLFGGAALVLLLVLPAAASPVSGVRAGPENGSLAAYDVLPAGANGGKSRWRKRCY
jgi:hypothetical protein